MRKLTVVKIGGNIIDSPAELEVFMDDFARLDGPKALVHGGGVMASEMLRGLGIEPQMVDGRRITDAETLRVVTMVYAGWINKCVVAGLQARGCDAVGLSGADGNAILAARRPPVPIDYGHVGDISAESVNVLLLEKLLSGGLVPVFCAVTHDGHGRLLNTNADTVAASVAAALSARYAVRLVYCFEKRGVLTNPVDDASVVPTLDAAGYQAMKASGAVNAGMIAKLDNAFAAIGGGVTEVVVKHASDLLTEAGTVIIAEA